ncbi:MAG TPA: mercuric reductase [Anaeromyxobacteraceae bacterium]|nr:mercuric reductase [Anaeromyxobacteraceae bacterium]
MTTAAARAPVLIESDPHDQELVRHVRPPGWKNPVPASRYDLVVVGAGTAGLVSALGAAGLGARVALAERALLGGDCLNHGCVPSKGVIRASRAAFDARQAADFGVETAAAPRVDFGAAMARMRRLRAGIARADSAARATSLGVDVFLGDGRFVAEDALEVAGARLRFKRAVVATGARASAPPVPGLAEAGYRTNETIFTITELPRRLAVIGAGPIGCELGQAFRRFGAEVTVVAADPRPLPREDPEASAVLRGQLEREGVRLVLGGRLVRVDRRGEERILVVEKDGATAPVACDEILVAVGRAPNVEGLALEAAGVGVDRSGVVVDGRLRTANPRIFAAGDVCSAWKFTHAADAMARLVLRNAFFFGRGRASDLVIPWATYTDPEVAHVGLTAAEAAERGEAVRTLTVRFHEVDRAILDGEPEGFARIHVDARSGRLLGATAVARHAGEMIGEPTLAIGRGLGAADLSATVHPYPTQAEVWRKLGDAWQRSRLTPRARRVLATLVAWRR